MVRTASARNQTLAIIAATVIADGTRRVKPSVYLRPMAHTISSRPASTSQSQAMDRLLDEHRAAAVHREDLPGDVGRAGEKSHGARDVLGRAGAAERRGGDDALPLRVGKLPILGPGDGAGRDAVHAHAGRELDGERARQGGEAGLGYAVERIALERPLGVDVDDVDDRALVLRQLRRRLLRDEERRAQV